MEVCLTSIYTDKRQQVYGAFVERKWQFDKPLSEDPAQSMDNFFLHLVYITNVSTIKIKIQLYYHS